MGFIIKLLSMLMFFFNVLYPVVGVNLLGNVIKKIHQFGDSLSDTGNSIRINSNLPANRFPYGKTFPGNPTGRWCDGRLIIDFTAEFLCLEPLEPYLNSSATFQSGVNFAVAGATDIDPTILLSNFSISSQQVPGLPVQISWFETYITPICSNQSECKIKLKDSLMFFGEIGGNDINAGISSKKTLDELYSFVRNVTKAIEDGIKELISVGATKFVVPGNFPIGCIPPVIKAFANNPSTNEFGCNEAANQLAKKENELLRRAIIDLNLMFPEVKITYLDYYNAFEALLTESLLSGIPKADLLKICCGTGDFFGASESFCGSPGVSVCDNPNKFIIWDGFHLTEAAYRYIFEFLAPTILLAIV